MTQTLKVAKLTPKQTKIVAQLLTYFSSRSIRAMKKLEENPTYIEPIPLTKIYEMFKCNAQDRKAVKIAAHVYFTPLFRGNNMSKKCSGWTPRKEIHINSQVEQMIFNIFEANRDNIEDFRTVLNTKSEDNKTKVTMTSTFSFADKQQADTFAMLLQNVLEQNALEMENETV